METTKIIEQAYANVRLFNSLAGNLINVTAESIDNQIGFIFSELEETITGFEGGDRVEVLDGACDLFVTVTGLMQKLEAAGYDVATALQRVNENNLSKFPRYFTDEDMQEGWTVTYNHEAQRFVIKNQNDKVMKPASFVPVDIADLVAGATA